MFRRALQAFKLVMEGHQFQSNTLKNRGWILQELMLSPRTLHFSTEQIFWQCRSGAFAEGDVEPVEFDYWPSYHWQNQKDFLLQTDTDEKIVAECKNRSPDGWLPRSHFYSIPTKWLRTVHEFSTRKLTVAADRFPALSGIAIEIASSTKWNYVAGLWDGDLHRGLLWDSHGTYCCDRVPCS